MPAICHNDATSDSRTSLKQNMATNLLICEITFVWQNRFKPPLFKQWLNLCKAFTFKIPRICHLRFATDDYICELRVTVSCMQKLGDARLYLFVYVCTLDIRDDFQVHHLRIISLISTSVWDGFAVINK